MNRAIIALAGLAVYPFLGASSCATTGGPEPKVVVQRVEIPVIAPCPDKRDPAPTFVGTKDNLTAALTEGIDKAFKIMLADQDQRIKYQAASDAQIAACAAPPRPG